MIYQNLSRKIELNTNPYTYKVGMNEVKGLKEALTFCLNPFKEALQKKVYWSSIQLEEAEYLSRDGFIPHSHNKGGLQINIQIPDCESYSFPALEFGELDESDFEGCKTEEEREALSESYSSEGHLDAYLSVWFKFEGIDEEGYLNFYLVASGGNNDAPYFRNIPTIFETEFKVRTLNELKKVGSQKVKSMTKKILR